jgi:hypothetical protein
MNATPQSTGTIQPSSFGCVPTQNQSATTDHSTLKSAQNISPTSSPNQISAFEGNFLSAAMSLRPTADTCRSQSSISTQSQSRAYEDSCQMSPTSLPPTVETISSRSSISLEGHSSSGANRDMSTTAQQLKSNISTLRVGWDPESTIKGDSPVAHSNPNPHKTKRRFDANGEIEDESQVEISAGKKVKVESTKDKPEDIFAGKRQGRSRSEAEAEAEATEAEPRLIRGWCKKERDILLRLANEQLQLESIDENEPSPGSSSGREFLLL